MNELLQGALSAVAEVDPWLRTLLAGVAIMLETSILVGLVVPGDSVVLVASTAVGSPVQYVALVLAVICGALVGESIGFWLGRTIGPWLKSSRVGRWIGTENWDRAQRYVDRRGGIAVFLSRFLPVLHSVVPLTVGMGRMRYRTFLAWTAPACVLWTLLYVTVGWQAADTFKEVSKELHSAGFIFVGAVVLFGLLVWGAKKLILRAEARHMEVAVDSAPEVEPVTSEQSN